ncbi:MAG: hypothetical protein DMG12_14925 [Acidobacteria bacterium]|nr:MAG: hypothetical protein DMG12_14925 [Acidobacteriota bacterium]
MHVPGQGAHHFLFTRWLHRKAGAGCGFAPAEADVLWANALILAASARFGPSSAEWTGYLELLGRLQSEGKLDGKVGAALGTESVAVSFSTVILQLGLIAVPPVSDAARAVTHGRQIATVARALKECLG